MKRKELISLMAAIVGTVALLMRPALAGSPVKIPSESWLGVYLADQKMGYMHITVNKAAFQGRDCWRIQSFMRNKLTLLGAGVQQDVKTVVYMDERFAPIFETFHMSSGGSNTVIEAKFGDKEIRCRISTGESNSVRVVPIPPGASLVGDSMYALGSEKPEVGRRAKTHYFNPMTLAVEPMDVEVLRREQVEIKGRKYDTFVIKNTTQMGDMTTWQTEDGAIIKAAALLGLTMQIESPEEAVAGVDSGYTPPPDLAVISSVKANVTIPEPRKVRRLIVKLSGKLDPKMTISDSWQKVKWIGGKDGNAAAQYVVESVRFDSRKSVRLPFTDEKLSVYLQPTAYLQSDDPEIKNTAAKIVGGEKSAYAAAEKIRAWLSANMRPQADIGISRPATDVLKARVGVCRDYAILFSSLARAAGIPTKVVAGIVYMNGRFYYHAWAESYVGQWVAFDAVLGDGFVDATHIKLAEGDATNMFDIVRLFGSLKAEIIKFE